MGQNMALQRIFAADMTEVKKLTLNKGREKSMERRHPWIFSGAIHKIPAGLDDGDLVEVRDYRDQFLAKGHYAGGSIAVRILTFEDRPCDANFWAEKIGNAASYRRRHLSLPGEHTNAFRLIHGEGDGLPGLVVDVYKNVAVIQCHSFGMLQSIDLIAQSILKVYDGVINAIYLKSEEALKSGKRPDGWLAGNPVEKIMVLEYGHQFIVNVETGQKTGFFLDQRENRNLVGLHSAQKTVLNCFCYTGGFSVFALNGGASAVVSVDISKTATAIVDENISFCENAGLHESVTANVLEYLKSEDVPEYDVVIIDPPAFAKSVAKRHNAVQAYKRLNALALTKVKPGGLLFTFSCSQVVGTQLFYDTIVAAAIEVGREVRVIQHLSQGGDHPVNLFHPEGHYLKGLMLEVS